MFRWFETRIDPFPRDPIRQPPDRLVAFFWYYLKPVWWAFAFLTATTLVLAGLEVLVLAFVGRVVDMMKATPDPRTFFADHAGELVLMTIVTLILRPVLSVVADLFKQQMIMGPVNIRVRWLAHRYVLRQSLGYFQNDFAGRIATRVIQVGPAVRDVAANLCDIVVWVTVHWVGAFLLFLAADWRLVIPLTVWLGGYVVALTYFVPRIERLSHAMSDARSMLTGRIVDSYTNIATVKLFAHAEREDAFARSAFDEFLSRYKAQLRLNTWMEVTLWTLNGLVLVVTTGLAIWLWSVDVVSIGAIAVVTGLIIRLMNMSGWFMWTLAGIFDNIGVVQESMQTIARPPQIVDAPAAKALEVTEGGIEFEAIEFRYAPPPLPERGRFGRTPGDGEIVPLSGGIAAPRRSVISDLSLSIRPGEKVGLVGRSGAGKSTLINLLLRFYDLEKGRIRIDGQDIALVTQDSLRAQIGVVTQDTSLLHRSVMDNILYGRPDASREAVAEAARMAQAHEFIEGLEDARGRRGYEAHVGERGVKLSGGQRQRIAIARVLLKNAPILVLDEATSALDSEAEQAIQEQLNNLMSGKTVIAIAHRLSTIAAMDRLVILDKGRVIEDGSHRELIDRGGVYAELWARQSGGFIAKEAAE
ncbi:MAG: ABC transporter ATP-binding protein [Hyphomicrobiaceae bacterium]|nr:ABC transporter ATP-binding protein [Hyphomicrobiaceae bacterium]